MGRDIQALVLDFDNTIAVTLEPGPNGQSVQVAYLNAIKEIFGSIAAKIFESHVSSHISGMSPREIVEQILNKHSTRDLCVAEARKNLITRGSVDLYNYVPPCKGTTLVWAEADPLRCLVEAMIRLKVKYLLSIVNQNWPPLAAGFQIFMREVGSGLPWGIVSAGHDLVIGKVLGIHDLEPVAMITDDDTRGWLAVPPEERMKPHPRLMDNLLAQISMRREAPVDRQKILYIGDSIPTDHLFAVNAGVRFAWYNPEGVPPPDGYELPPEALVFSHWEQLPGLLF